MRIAFLVIAMVSSATFAGEGSGKVEIGSTPTIVSVPLSKDFAAELGQVLDAKESPKSVRILLSDVNPPGGEMAIEGVRVFAAVPQKDGKFQTEALRPKKENPHYVGTFAFSPLEGAPPEKESFALDIGPALRALRQRDLVHLNDRLDLVLVAKESGKAVAPAHVSIPIQDVSLLIR